MSFRGLWQVRELDVRGEVLTVVHADGNLNSRCQALYRVGGYRVLM